MRRRREPGLPYSKFLMSQSLTASGLSPERGYELARIVERRLAHGGAHEIDVGALDELAEQVVLEHEGEQAVERLRAWRRLDRLDRPLVVLLSGTTGVGKSTLAALLAHRLGISRVIPTDVIRHVLRSFFPHERMPAVHYSSFEAGWAVGPDGPGGLEAGEGEDEDLVGYLRQAETIATGIGAIVDRACLEGTPMVVEGVHVLPGGLDQGLRRRCLAVEALVVVEDERLHRAHFALRGGDRPAGRYLGRFEQIRKLQDHLGGRAAAAGVPVIDNVSIDRALARTMELVLAAAGRLS